MFALDKTDITLLQLLQQNASLTIKQVALKIGMSPTAVFERKRKLEKNKVITHYAVVIDPEKIGKNLLSYCYVTLKEHSDEKLRKFEQEVNKIEEITECNIIAGNADYILKIITENISKYNLFLDKLSKLPNINTTKSIIVLRQIKNTAHLSFS
jgi:Lrp/AsnC family leucine-responsive transcriptional regulator